MKEEKKVAEAVNQKLKDLKDNPIIQEGLEMVNDKKPEEPKKPVIDKAEIPAIINSKFNLLNDNTGIDFIDSVNQIRNETIISNFIMVLGWRLAERSEELIMADPSLLDSCGFEMGSKIITDDEIESSPILSQTDGKYFSKEVIWFALSMLKLNGNINTDQYMKYIDPIYGIKILKQPMVNDSSEITTFIKKFLEADSKDGAKFVTMINSITMAPDEEEVEKAASEPEMQDDKAAEEDDKDISAVEKENVKDQPVEVVNNVIDPCEPSKERFKFATQSLSKMIDSMTKDLEISYAESDGDMIAMTIKTKRVSQNGALNRTLLIDTGSVCGNGFNLLLPFIRSDNGKEDYGMINIYRHRDIINKVLHNDKYMPTPKETEAINKDYLPEQSIYAAVDFSGMKKFILHMNEKDKAALTVNLQQAIGTVGPCRLRFTEYTNPNNFVLVSDNRVKIQIPYYMLCNIAYCKATVTNGIVTASKISANEDQKEEKIA